MATLAALFLAGVLIGWVACTARHRAHLARLEQAVEELERIEDVDREHARRHYREPDA